MSSTSSTPSTPSTASSPSPDRGHHSLNNNNFSLQSGQINNNNSRSKTKRYPARTLMRLQYSPPPPPNSTNNDNMWRAKENRALSPDFHIIQQQLKLFQNMNQ